MRDSTDSGGDADYTVVNLIWPSLTRLTRIPGEAREFKECENCIMLIPINNYRITVMLYDLSRSFIFREVNIAIYEEGGN